jgi:hypothetical protein
MKKPPPRPPPKKPEPTVIFALPKPWPQMAEDERETFVHEWYVALTKRVPGSP